MDSAQLATDSSGDAEQHLAERWRGMTADRKLLVSLQMSQTVRELAVAAYPEIAALDRAWRVNPHKPQPFFAARTRQRGKQA